MRSTHRPTDTDSRLIPVATKCGSVVTKRAAMLSTSMADSMEPSTLGPEAAANIA
jgi:hypothetical protein